MTEDVKEGDNLNFSLEIVEAALKKAETFY
jgi:hypothetical protein